MMTKNEEKTYRNSLYFTVLFRQLKMRIVFMAPILWQSITCNSGFGDFARTDYAKHLARSKWGEPVGASDCPEGTKTHTAIMIRQKLRELRWEVLIRLLYSSGTKRLASLNMSNGLSGEDRPAKICCLSILLIGKGQGVLWEGNYEITTIIYSKYRTKLKVNAKIEIHDKLV